MAGSSWVKRWRSKSTTDETLHYDTTLCGSPSPVGENNYRISVYRSSDRANGSNIDWWGDFDEKSARELASALQSWLGERADARAMKKEEPK